MLVIPGSNSGRDRRMVLLQYTHKTHNTNTSEKSGPITGRRGFNVPPGGSGFLFSQKDATGRQAASFSFL